jgi:hypothetical protein
MIEAFDIAVECIDAPAPGPSQPSRPKSMKLRDLVWPVQSGARNAYDPRFVREFGCTPALLLSQLVFWSDKGHDPDGWIYKTKEEIRQEVGLSNEQTDRSRKRLQVEGVIEAEKRPRRDRSGRVVSPSPVWHYRVDFAALAQRLGIEVPTLEHESKPREVQGSSIEMSRTRTPESTGDEPRISPASYTESTCKEELSENSKEQTTVQVDGEPDISDLAARRVTDVHPSDMADTASVTNDLDVVAQRRVASEGINIDDLITGQIEHRQSAPGLDRQTKDNLWWLMYPVKGENAVSKLVAAHFENRKDPARATITAEHIAKEASNLLGAEEPLEAYVAAVEYALPLIESSYAS